MNVPATQYISYPKESIDRVTQLLDSLKIHGDAIHNSQIIAVIVQTLKTQGTVQTSTSTADEQNQVVDAPAEVINEG